MTLSEFESRFVVDLGGSTRAKIWEQFLELVAKPIASLDIKCEFWLDGSFITECKDPDDLDGSLMIQAEVIDNLNQEALTYLKYFDDYDCAFPKELDLFLCQLYPKGHPLREDMNDPDGWAWQWSRERNSGWLKGFAVIPFR
ncbi:MULTISPECIES: hypothetical protein [unclassified Sphingomonas]|jgi:hypothetical protein|uniref:DUF6932 family protein n=1 Tax=Sphingomonas sp. CCH19-C6 TaxID=1768783 RepID=UPI000A978C15|nr:MULTISPECIES: hypothetical protein [unclassified Sphingomonas]